jgi:hypothetical protein
MSRIDPSTNSEVPNPGPHRRLFSALRARRGWTHRLSALGLLAHCPSISGQHRFDRRCGECAAVLVEEALGRQLGRDCPERPAPPLRPLPTQTLGQLHQFGIAPGMALAALAFALSLTLRSRAPRSFATVIALSNSLIAPSTWRTSLSVGVSSQP